MTSAGDDAERLAEQYLCEHGLKLLARNYRCRAGEIDLIMQDRSAVVFVEVRLRTHSSFGGAAESIAPRKQQRIVTAAQHYLAGQTRTPPCRFDAVLLNKLDARNIEWLQNAFEA